MWTKYNKGNKDKSGVHKERCQVVTNKQQQTGEATRQTTDRAQPLCNKSAADILRRYTLHTPTPK